VVKLTYIDSNGVYRDVEAEEGTTVMEAAIRNMIPGIEGECGGACACATCHVYVHEDWLNKIDPPDQTEQDMLSFAQEAQPNSRLSCQIKLRADISGLIVTTPVTQF
jgi:ferredoxin, 2Fe-2S